MSEWEQYQFGEFTLDVGERRLSRGGTPIHVGPKTYDVLVALVRKPGRLVTKLELLEQVWPAAFVEEGILTVHASSLRQTPGRRQRASGLHRNRFGVWLSFRCPRHFSCSGQRWRATTRTITPAGSV